MSAPEIVPVCHTRREIEAKPSTRMSLLTNYTSLRALEDGAILGTLLGKIDTKLQIPVVTALYEKLRKERTDRIRDETFRQQKEHHLTDGEEQEARDKYLAGSFDVQDVW